MKSVRRGFFPEDKEYFSGNGLAACRTAARDSVFLINRGYSKESAVRFTGDHYSLIKRQRMALVRSLASFGQLQRRRKKSVEFPGSVCALDGFNIIITLETALSSSLLLDCMDGTVRDLAGLHGSYRIIEKTSLALDLLFEYLGDIEKKSGEKINYTIYLDKQISNSGRLGSLVTERAGWHDCSAAVKLVPSVDVLLEASDCAMTADSVVIDRCRTWYNLAHRIIEKYIPDAWLVSVWRNS
ncbi:MAG: DUF434 domain-containing protein [Treponema sp.]|jgi:hypothetical protein|nr:DUF434 domain-containing protein [Treponema sp.]